MTWCGLSKLAIGTALHSHRSRCETSGLGSLVRGSAGFQCEPFVFGDGQAVDTQVVANAVADVDGPASIHNSSECKVTSQEPELGGCGQTGETDIGQVDENAAGDEGSQHDSPHGEILASEMGEDDFGCHATECR